MRFKSVSYVIETKNNATFWHCGNLFLPIGGHIVMRSYRVSCLARRQSHLSYCRTPGTKHSRFITENNHGDVPLSLIQTYKYVWSTFTINIFNCKCLSMYFYTFKCHHLDIFVSGDQINTFCAPSYIVFALFICVWILG